MINKKTITITENQIRKIVGETLSTILKESLQPSVEDGIEYVRQNKTWSEEDEQNALDLIDHYRCDLEYADYDIYSEISALMNEFAEDYGYPEGWFQDIDANYVFMKL